MLTYVVLLNMTTQPWHIAKVSNDFVECENVIAHASSQPSYINAIIECWDAATGQFEEEWEY